MAWILIGSFIALILLRVPISIAIGMATVLTFLTSDFSNALQIIPQQMLEGVNKASLTAVPFFIMAGNLMNVTGVTERIFAFANALVGHLKAGLAQVTSGSSPIRRSSRLLSSGVPTRSAQSTPSRTRSTSRSD